MFEHQKILILGFARSGYEAAKVLVKRENTIIITDSKTDHDEKKVKELEDMGVRFVLGENPISLLDDSFDYVIKNPGVPIHHPYVIKAREKGIPVINEVELAYRLLPKDIKLIAITGTNGKTTTTTLIYELIKASEKTVHLTGNIGYPLCSFLDKIQNGDIVVMEVSSQQLENLEEFHPTIAVMTNLSPAHIDFFGSYENYKQVKYKIFQNQVRGDIAILNIEDENILAGTKNILSTTKYFSSKNEINGSYIKDHSIYYYDEKVLDLSSILLKGNHNYENIMASLMVAKELGISNEIIEQVISSFPGVEHRLEYVGTWKKRKFYNDSKATNNKSCQIALSAFTDPILLLMGGLDRGQDFSELTPYMQHVKQILCYGENKEKIKEYAQSISKPVLVLDTLSEATKKAYTMSLEGDIILLSPATASWDQYQCFEDRGTEFKQIVKEIMNDEN